MSRYTDDEYVATSSFKCEGCGERFLASRLWRPSRKWVVGDPLTCTGERLANYVCSKRCATLAIQQKMRRGETLMRLRIITAFQEGLTVEWIVAHCAVLPGNAYLWAHEYYGKAAV